MHILVTGGCGYIGSVLVPKLLTGHHVTVLDTMWFGNTLEPHRNLSIVQGDIREPHAIKAEAVIHLANIPNDSAGALRSSVTWEVNALGMKTLVESSIRHGATQFLYASSGSVYGISNAVEVTEDHPLVPLTDYNKSKAVAERVLLSYEKDLVIQIIRPGTCCGVSPNQRLDITVNGMVASALCGRIEVANGDQYRPNIHIQDLTDLFAWMLERPWLIGIWNACAENMTGDEIAFLVGERVKALIVRMQSKDRRSYRMSNAKLSRAGFMPRFGVEDAIDDLLRAGHKQSDSCYRVKSLQSLSFSA